MQANLNNCIVCDGTPSHERYPPSKSIWFLEPMPRIDFSTLSMDRACRILSPSVLSSIELWTFWVLKLVVVFSRLFLRGTLLGCSERPLSGPAVVVAVYRLVLNALPLDMLLSIVPIVSLSGSLSLKLLKIPLDPIESSFNGPKSGILSLRP